jgi:hypothetical protein
MAPDPAPDVNPDRNPDLSASLAAIPSNIAHIRERIHAACRRASAKIAFRNSPQKFLPSPPLIPICSASSAST